MHKWPINEIFNDFESIELRLCDGIVARRVWIKLNHRHCHTAPVVYDLQSTISNFIRCFIYGLSIESLFFSSSFSASPKSYFIISIDATAIPNYTFFFSLKNAGLFFAVSSSMIESLTSCFCRLAASPRNGPNPNVDNSVSLRMTHSVNSRNDNSNAFQCSEFDSRRFLETKNKHQNEFYVFCLKGKLRVFKLFSEKSAFEGRTIHFENELCDIRQSVNLRWEH